MRAALLGLAVLTAGCSIERDTGFGRGVTDGPLAGELAIPAALAGDEKLSGVGAEGLRVLIQPSFSRYAYYLSFRRMPDGCLPRDRRRGDIAEESRGCGPTLVHVRRTDRANHTAVQTAFFLPPEPSDNLFEELDARLGRWKGSNAGGTDGTGVDLERIRDGAIKSMSSNASPSQDIDNPAGQLRKDLLRILLAYGPSGFAPRSDDWHVRGDGDDPDRCNDTALAEPLDTGFGAGNSDCDAQRRWPERRAGG